jgi:ABC-type Fe3+ transport system substrate-binding protein
MAPTSVISKAKHPNAARLLAHFVLSEEGQKAIINEGYQHSSRKDIKPRKGTTYVPFTDPRLQIPHKRFFAEHDERMALYEKMFGLLF